MGELLPLLYIIVERILLMKILKEYGMKFYKTDKARTREYGGNGIGLSIVKAIMDSMGQEYGVRNVSDGVEFWFNLDCKS